MRTDTKASGGAATNIVREDQRDADSDRRAGTGDRTRTEDVGATENVGAMDDRSVTTGRSAIEAIRERLKPERIVSCQGRPVRLVGSWRWSVRATIVEPGFFTVSETGFRSIQTPLWWLDKAGISEEEAFDYVEAQLDGIAEASMESRLKTRKRLTHTLPEGGHPVRLVVMLTRPSQDTLAGLILTGEGEERRRLIRSAIRLYELARQLPEMTEEEWAKAMTPTTSRWTLEQYQRRRTTAHETLAMLNAAHSGGLFSGEEDLRPCVEAATLQLQRVYRKVVGMTIEEIVQDSNIGWWEDAVRHEMRDDLGLDVLRPQHLDELAERMHARGIRTWRTSKAK